MKKNNDRWKRWHYLRAENQSRRSGRVRKLFPIQIWQGQDVEFGFSTRPPSFPPSLMCLDRNAIEVTNFLEGLRRRLLRAPNRAVWGVGQSRTKTRLIRGFLDFAAITEISTSAALVLAAEYERIVTFIGKPPPIINLDRWKEDVFQRLLQLGFFSSIGIAKLDAHLVTGNDDVMTLRFLSGSNAEETAEADKMLTELGSFLDPNQELSEEMRLPLMSALTEAMVNVRRHAYPADHQFRFKHISRWWLTGSADRVQRKLTVVIYDQGATIPITYANHSNSQSIKEWIDDVVAKTFRLQQIEKHPFALDGVKIAAAAKFGNSQTGKSYRGKGLPDMHRAIDVCKKGRLMILSRGGRYVYRGQNDLEITEYPSSIGGTLIEWTIFLPDTVCDEV